MHSPLLESATDVPIVWFSVLTRLGSSGDPVGGEGLTRHCFELARRGTVSRSRVELDRALDDLGASLDPVVGRDWAGLSGVCLSRDFDTVVAITADILGNASFLDSEHIKLKKESSSVLANMRDDDATMALRFFLRDIAPGHPYSRTSLGTEESLANLDLADSRERWNSMIAGDLVLAFAGDLSREDADRASAVWRDAVVTHPPAPAQETSTPSTARKVLLVDKPDRNQAQIVMGVTAPQYGTDAYTSLVLAEVAFGGTFSSRMNQEVRVKRGWSYGAGCHMGKGRMPHFWRMSLAPSDDVAAEAALLVSQMFDELCQHGLTADELEFARQHVTGSLPFERATARRRLQIAIENEMYGLPEDFEETVEKRLRRISLAEVNAALATHLSPKDLVIVALCSADHVQEDFEDAFGAVEVCAWDAY